MKKIREKEMEYPDAPSGYVTLYNYKEPFMKYEGGFGFQGALLFDGSSGKVQCHMCGSWHESLAPHLAKEHNMYAQDYKELVGLNNKTALISDKVREKLIAKGLGKRMKNLKNRKGTKVSEEVRAKIKATLLKNRRELQNIHGTCPLQLVTKLQSEYQLLGYTPRSPHHFNRVPEKYKEEAKESAKRLGSIEPYLNVFGSWENACKAAGIPYRVAGSNVNRRPPRWTKEAAIKWVADFMTIHNKEPLIKDIPKSLERLLSILSTSGNKLDRKEIYKSASIEYNQCRGIKGTRYSKEQLLDFLRNFKKIHGRVPSYSDSRRGLIPHLSRYSYNFGSWKKAILAAKL